MNNKGVSVICPTYNEGRYVGKVIESVMGQDYHDGKIELIFVDGMSCDDTRLKILEMSKKYPNIRCIDNTKRIVPVALNIGIENSIYDYVIRVDAHSEYPQNYISELLRRKEELGADNVGVCCQTLPVNDSIMAKAIAVGLSSVFGVGNAYFRIGVDKVRTVDTVPFGCFTKDLFKRIGYFDETLVRNQDDEFNARIIKNGGKVYLLPGMKVKYYPRDSVGKLFKMYYQYGLFRPLANKRLGHPQSIRKLLPLFFVIYLAASMVFSLFSQFVFYQLVVVMMLYVFLGVWSASKVTGNLKVLARMPYVYMAIHISYGIGYIAGILRLLTPVGEPVAVSSSR